MRVVVVTFVILLSACNPASSEPGDWPVSWPEGQGTVTVTFLHVVDGEVEHRSGDATLIQAPDATILVDTGLPLTEEYAVELVPLLAPRGVDHIDVLVGTHPHYDHIGQHPEVIDAFSIGEAWMPGHSGMIGANPGPNRHSDLNDAAVAAIDAAGITLVEPRAGDVHQVGSLTVEVLHPEQPQKVHWMHRDVNDDSLVLRLTIGDVRVLLMGDAQRWAEGMLLGSGVDVAADITTLGHHGVEGAASNAFLEAVDPQVAVWSADQPHSPDRWIAAKVMELGASLYGTAAHGHIEVRIRDSYAVSTGRDLDAFTTVEQLEAWQAEAYPD